MGMTVKYRSTKMINEVERLYREKKWSQHRIAKKFGVHQVTIGRILRSRGIQPEKRISSGATHGRWKGGRVLTGEGYVWILVSTDHPMASMRNYAGYVPEHRLIMAEHIGRPLKRTETVHHIDGDHAHNTVENLQLRQGRHGRGMRYQCQDCGGHNIMPVSLGKD